MLGIACGSLNTVVGVKKGAGVDIVLSLTSKRASPVVITFGDKERFYGDEAAEIQKSRVTTSINYMPRTLGFQPEWEGFDKEFKYSLAKPKLDNLTGRTCFEIDYKGKTEVVYPESAMGLFFNKLKKLWATGVCTDTQSVSVSVPDFFTVNERQAMIDAVRVADLKLIQLVNESSANCLNYGLFRRSQLDDKTPRIVAFVDVGQSKTSVFFGSFTKNNQKVISVTTDRNCGGRDFDYILTEFFANMFNKKYGSNPITKDKCVIRMMEVVAKARKILSGNSDTQVSIESWLDDEDLSYLLSRNEFEQIVAPVVARIKETFTRAILESKLKPEEIHSVEMVGDVVRTPLVQQAVKEIFGQEVSKTLAPDESIARGTTLFSALSSPFFQIKDYSFEHFNNHTIQIEYPFMKDGQIQIRTHKIISKGDHFPTKKSIKFTEKQMPPESVINIKLSYLPEEAPHMKNPIIQAYEIHLPKVNSEKFEFVLHFVMDQNGVPFIERGNLNEVWFEDAPVDKNVDGKEKTDNKDNKMDVEHEPKKIKKEKSHQCIINITEQNYSLSRNIVDKCIEKEKLMEQDDLALRAVQHKRNEIEQFIYKTREKLDQDLANFILPNEKPALIEEMNKVEEWLYSDDPLIEDMNVLITKSQNLNDIGQTIYKRYHEWDNVLNAGNQLNILLRNIENKSKADYEKLTKGDQLIRLTPADFEEIQKSLDLYKGKLQETSRSLEGAVRTSFPPVLDKAVIQYCEDLNKKVEQIYINAENRYQEARRKEEKEKKDKEDKEKKEKEKKEQEEKAKKEGTTNTTNTEGAKPEEKSENKDVKMDVD